MPLTQSILQALQQPLTLAELNAFIQQIPPDRLPLVLLMSDAGLRKTEALSIQCQQIDLPGGQITIHGKGGKHGLYPILTERLHNALANAKGNRTTGPLVTNPKTGQPYDSLKTLFRLAAKRAGITKPVGHHTLRHTYSTLLLELGIPTEVRQKLMRHSTLAATQHYTHISPAWLQS